MVEKATFADSVDKATSRIASLGGKNIMNPRTPKRKQNLVVGLGFVGVIGIASMIGAYRNSKHSEIKEIYQKERNL